MVQERRSLRQLISSVSGRDPVAFAEWKKELTTWCHRSQAGGCLNVSKPH